MVLPISMLALLEMAPANGAELPLSVLLTMRSVLVEGLRLRMAPPKRTARFPLSVQLIRFMLASKMDEIAPPLKLAKLALSVELVMLTVD